MPAIITHDFFGRDVYDRLFSLIGGSRDESEAFLLGSQGPDPLFFTVISPRFNTYSQLGHLMHKEKPNEVLKAFKDSLSVLDESEYSIGRAYALGFLCHYSLDSIMHPYVFFHQYRLCDAGEPCLSRKDGSEVHGVIETELDELVLFAKREITIADYKPAKEILKASNFTLDVISKMYVYVAMTVFGQIIPSSLFKHAVKDYRTTQTILYSRSGTKRALGGRLERLVKENSRFQSLSHRAVELSESPFDNREHARWKNPFTGETFTTSFWDLYETGLFKALDNIHTFDTENFSLDDARDVTRNLNFSGESTIAVLLSVESDQQSRESAESC